MKIAIILFTLLPNAATAWIAARAPSFSTARQLYLDEVREPTTAATPPSRLSSAPWTTSKFSNEKLRYSAIWDEQVELMQAQLTNLKEVAVPQYGDVESEVSRMTTRVFESDEYRYIRLTSLDSGKGSEVFTSVWYPRHSSTPIFGCDFLRFGNKRICVVDFQPVSDESRDFESTLKPIRDRYETLHDSMTDRFYHAEDGYFSNQMLLGRSDTDDVVEIASVAYKEYLRAHVELTKSAAPSDNVEELHADYDTYSAERDPALAMLGRVFGKEWADGYVHTVMFPQARRSS